MAFTYPYDPTGEAGSNLIVDEMQTVVAPDPLSDQANFIVPHAAPFFQSSLQIWTGPGYAGTKLVEGVDYKLTHEFYEAEIFLEVGMYGSIMFLNRAYAGNVYLSYQTLGGPYTLNDTSVVTNLTRSLYCIMVVTWTQINGLPALFPPAPHDTDSADLTGMADVVNGLAAMTTAIINAGADVPSLVASLTAHVATGGHTKDKVGLANVDNFATAITADVDNRATNKFLTPAMGVYMLSRFAVGGIVPTMYGVGDVYTTTDLTRDPAVFLGYGTWSSAHVGTLPDTTPIHQFVRTA